VSGSRAVVSASCGLYTEIRSPGWAETSYSVRVNVISPAA
jgi:hypothetical protein